MSTPDNTENSAPYGKKNPFPAKVQQMYNLNKAGSAKETFHVELSLEGSGLEYVPGDVAGVFPVNCPEVVDDFLQVTGLDAHTTVEHGGSDKSLLGLFTNDVNITTVNLPFMKKYAAMAENPALTALLESGDRERINGWLWGREIRDLIAEFPPSSPILPDQLVAILRPIAPRLYSIASSLRAHPDEVHLTVVAVQYEAHGRQRKGVCSTYLCQRIQPGDKVALYTHHNKNFGLPADPSAPMIMVGPGTGIAPFRAFLEEREATGANGNHWLFFGDQHVATDFLYQEELERHLANGLLNRLDVAFSRDQDYKIYVQDRIMENAADLYAWLQDGAYFYVCGDKERMAKDVDKALHDIYIQEGGLSQEAAEVAVLELKKAKRYQRDVY